MPGSVPANFNFARCLVWKLLGLNLGTLGMTVEASGALYEHSTNLFKKGPAKLAPKLYLGILRKISMMPG